MLGLGCQSQTAKGNSDSAYLLVLGGNQKGSHACYRGTATCRFEVKVAQITVNSQKLESKD